MEYANHELKAANHELKAANQALKAANQALKAGAQLYTVRDHTRTPQEVAKTLHRVAEIGYRAVQVSAFGPIEPREVARLAQQEGVEIVATHFGWDEFRNNLGHMIEVHQMWGCRHAAIGSLPKDYYRAGGASRFAAELAPIADRLAAAGIDFSYHNHSHELVRYGATTWLHQVYEAAPPQHLKAELDVYWLAAGGADPAQWISDLGARQPIIHCKDMVVLPDRTQRFAPVGAGNLNWPRIVAACRGAGVEWVLVEQDQTYGADPFAELAASLRCLQGMGIA